jgi:hypothetical protein
MWGVFVFIVSCGFCAVFDGWVHFGCTMSLFPSELNFTYIVDSTVVRFGV